MGENSGDNGGVETVRGVEFGMIFGVGDGEGLEKDDAAGSQPFGETHAGVEKARAEEGVENVWRKGERARVGENAGNVSRGVGQSFVGNVADDDAPPRGLFREPPRVLPHPAREVEDAPGFQQVYELRQTRVDAARGVVGAIFFVPARAVVRNYRARISRRHSP